jgi:hypothetical protein
MIGLKRKKNSNVQKQTHEYTGHPIEEDEEATKPSTAAKSFAVTKPSTAIKSSIHVELTDKEKRATNKKIMEEVLPKIPQFKAVLSVPNAFGPEH